MLEQRQKNVLVFDSGVGGLSVYKEVSTLLPSLNYIYVFDNEAYPYGELEPATLIRRVSCIIDDFIQAHHIDLVIIACNTASTIVLPALRQSHSIPIVGVVPAIKPASLISRKAVGLIATPATITREYTHDLIKNFSNDRDVKLLGSTRLVDIAENKLRGREVNLEELAEILSPLMNHIDVAVLGCTHFPLLKDEIQIVLGQDVVMIDSGRAIADRVSSLLDEKDNTKEVGTREVFCSALPMEESALNVTLNQLGFTPTQLHPILDV